MSGRRRGMARRTGFRRTKKFFHLAFEGAETEPRYFGLFTPARDANVQIKHVSNPGHKSHPDDVLGRLREHVKKHWKKGDEAWLVIDRDAWEESEIDRVCRDAGADGISVALSNPCFELWLYLHLKRNRNFVDRSQCQRELAKVLPDYSPSRKSSYDIELLRPGIRDAIGHARTLDMGVETQPWPKAQGTRVYLLVEKLGG